jgi:hypothetical protein
MSLDVGTSNTELFVAFYAQHWRNLKKQFNQKHQEREKLVLNFQE